MTKIHVQYTNKRIRRRLDSVLARLIQVIARESDAPTVIAIGGPGGTGKSTLATSIKKILKSQTSILQLDDYKTSRKFRLSRNIFGPHPQANEMTLIQEHLESIRAGKSFQKPIYNRIAGKIDKFKKFIPKSITLVEGEVATYKPFRPFCDLSIFVDSHWKTQLKTRLTRDIRDKGYDRDKAIATFLNSNLREFEKYGAQSKRLADIHVYCDEDFDMYIESIEETVFKTYANIFEKKIAPIDTAQKAVDISVPFSEKHQIDYRIFYDYLDCLFQNGVHRIIVGHFCGEGKTLTKQEQKFLIQSACEYFPGEIVFYTPALNLFDTRYLVQSAAEYGVDKIIVDVSCLPENLKEEGLNHYKEFLSKGVSSITFGLGKSVAIRQDPLRAKKRIQIYYKDFPLIVRPPY